MYHHELKSRQTYHGTVNQKTKYLRFDTAICSNYMVCGTRKFMAAVTYVHHWILF